MNKERSELGISRGLAPFLPERCAPLIAHWIVSLKVKFKVSRPRQTKLGDFRAGVNGRPHQITINSDLNPYAFLTTTVHEFAHLGCYLKHGHRVAPHGPEWKAIFSEMLAPFADHNIYPEDVKKAVLKHIKNPKASSCSCPDLTRVLARYDADPGVLLADLPLSTPFTFKGINFVANEKKRTRYLCTRLSDRKQYLISGRAKVDPQLP
jgi:predicted SprT family Zn-dependent metalloprotease